MLQVHRDHRDEGISVRRVHQLLLLGTSSYAISSNYRRRALEHPHSVTISPVVSTGWSTWAQRWSINSRLWISKSTPVSNREGSSPHSERRSLSPTHNPPRSRARPVRSSRLYKRSNNDVLVVPQGYCKPGRGIRTICRGN